MTERTILKLEIVETERGQIEIRQEPRWWHATDIADRHVAMITMNQLASAMLM